MKKILLATSFVLIGGQIHAQPASSVDVNAILALCTEQSDSCLAAIDDALERLVAQPPQQDALLSVLAQLAAIAINTARIDPGAAADMSEALRKIAAMSPDTRQVETLMALANDVSAGRARAIDLTAFAASPN